MAAIRGKRSRAIRDCRRSTRARSRRRRGLREEGDPGIIGKITVAVSGADSNRVYAVVENANGGVFASDDAGATWKKVSDDHNIQQRSFYFGRIYADPKTKDPCTCAMWRCIKSTDGGKTYRTVRTAHSDNHDMWIDPSNPLRMVESNDGGGGG